QSLAIGDLNGDGKADLAVAESGPYDQMGRTFTNSGVSVLLGKGDGTFQAAVNYRTGGNPPWGTPQSVVLGDFNGDGKPDLAVANPYGVLVFLNTCAAAGVDLAIAGNGGALALSWPFPSTGFVLESTTKLNPPNWQPVVEVPTTNAG